MIQEVLPDEIQYDYLQIIKNIYKLKGNYYEYAEF